MKRILTTPLLLALLLGTPHEAKGATSFVRRDGKRFIDIVCNEEVSP
jgi:hypothetical protein